MRAAKSEEASMGMLKTDLITPNSLQEVKTGTKLQGKCLRIISVESPVKLYCCYGVMAVLFAAVLSLSVALKLRKWRPVTEKCGPCYDTCPKDWIGFGSKCFHFYEDMINWTSSQTSCMELEAHLAIFESIEELMETLKLKQTQSSSPSVLAFAATVHTAKHYSCMVPATARSHRERFFSLQTSKPTAATCRTSAADHRRDKLTAATISARLSSAIQVIRWYPEPGYGPAAEHCVISTIILRHLLVKQLLQLDGNCST
ncbi:C-type lectin domain family 2 member H-like isoform X1, partial [Cricetulus griseus]|uniref:C-type lectin domain family 2 member H-like isoform X1 n=1 Tax=Cricetulus griseus TaxID=10029 RepID=UPI0007DA67F5